MCRFDVTKYIDRGGMTERAQMVEPGYEDQEGKVVMKGNSIEHPNAYIIYRIFVDSIQDGPSQPQSAAAAASSEPARKKSPNKKQKQQQQ